MKILSLDGNNFRGTHSSGWISTQKCHILVKTMTEIEPTDDQMGELYQQIGNPRSKDDLGEEGFVNAYHGSLVFKKLVTYVLECGYAFSDLQ